VGIIQIDNGFWDRCDFVAANPENFGQHLGNLPWQKLERLLLLLLLFGMLAISGFLN
jgi:hypothetical protein